MIKQHAIADFSPSQLIFSRMFVSETLLQWKKRTVRFTKVELWLIKRAHRAFPTRWMDVLNDVKANMGVRPEQTRQLYETGTFHQLKDWISQARETYVC